MDHPLRTISYIADIGNIVVLMARRRMPRPDSQENLEASDPGQESKRQYKMICHVFESEDVSPTAVICLCLSERSTVLIVMFESAVKLTTLS